MKDLWAMRLQLIMEDVAAEAQEDQHYSSQPVNHSEGTEGKSGRRKRPSRAMPRLIDTLGLCYLALVLLRLPVSIGDVHGWAFRGDIPFNRAIRHVPGVLKQKLPGEYEHALDTTSPLEADDVRQNIHQQCLLYEQSFGLVLPPLNTNLLLLKYMKTLALPRKLMEHSLKMRIEGF